MELICGCRHSADLRQVEQFVERATVVPLTAPISATAQKLVATYLLSHNLRIPDALIAATALSLHTTLYTKNVKHLRAMPDLTVVRPY